MTPPDRNRDDEGAVQDKSPADSAEITRAPRKSLLTRGALPGQHSDEITLGPGQLDAVPTLPPELDRMTIEVHRPGGTRQAPVFMSTGRIMVGRTQGEIQINDRMVSHQHATIEWQEHQAPVVQDLDSTNGTFLNGKRLSEPAVLQDKDEIRIGASYLSIRIPKA